MRTGAQKLKFKMLANRKHEARQMRRVRHHITRAKIAKDAEEDLRSGILNQFLGTHASPQAQQNGLRKMRDQKVLGFGIPPGEGSEIILVKEELVTFHRDYGVAGVCGGGVCNSFALRESSAAPGSSFVARFAAARCS